jgi:hypothetical protein
MINYSWQFLELFASDSLLSAVRYLLTAKDGKNTVETEGNHVFSNGVVNKPLEQIVETDLVQWIEKDTTIDDLNPIKSNLEDQLKNLTVKKVDFPWLANTFTIE